MKTFNTPENFKKALEEIVSQRQVEELFEHENAHYEKARELGYDASFIIEEIWERKSKKILCSICLDNVIYGTVPPEHLIAIALAPKNPSKRDYMVAEEYSLFGGDRI
jgi:hypothetical protein